MRYGKETNVSKEEVQISKAICVSLGDLDFVIETFKPAGIDVIFGVSDKSVQSLYLLSCKFHQWRDAVVQGSIKPFFPSITCFLRIVNLKQLKHFFLHRIAKREIRMFFKNFIKVLCFLTCIIYSLFAGSPPSVAAGASAISKVWTYIGELIFNMLVLVGSIKLSDQVVKNMMGL